MDDRETNEQIVPAHTLLMAINPSVLASDPSPMGRRFKHGQSSTDCCCFRQPNDEPYSKVRSSSMLDDDRG